MAPAPPPKFATPLDPRFDTYGPAVAGTARLMGTPLLPWQELVSNVIGQVHPDGRFVHPFVVITVPRQAGKTTLVLAKDVHRCLYLPNQRCWYTAQTGKYARDKWGEMVDVLQASTSPIRPLIRKVKRTNGDEILTFINGSTLAPHPPTRDGLHSKQSDVNDIDEAWAHDALAGAALMGAITPTQTTRPRRQTVVLSTMGDARSEWFHDLVDKGAGRGAYVDVGPDPGIALFEWGVPEGTDPDDLDTIAAYHPAFGHLCDMQSLTDARSQLGPGEFLRAYGNLRSGAAERVIPEQAFNAAATGDKPTGRPAFGVAVAADRSHASIWAGFLRPDGSLLVELVDRRDGVGWVLDRLVELNTEHRSIGVAADPGGPAGPVVDAYRLHMTKRGSVKPDRPPVLPLTRPDYAAACADVFDRITATHPETGEPAPTWRWRPDEGGYLAASVAIANRLHVGDGGFVWGRRASAGSVADFEAATLAGFAALRSPKPSAKPRIFVPAA